MRLSLAVSEAFLGSGGSGEKAAQHAQQGLDLAQEHGLDTAAAHMQIGRRATLLTPSKLSGSVVPLCRVY